MKGWIFPNLWAQAIWININYLALYGLQHYRQAEGPHKALAEQVCVLDHTIGPCHCGHMWRSCWIYIDLVVGGVVMLGD
jgi:hypothetical protein